MKRWYGISAILVSAFAFYFSTYIVRIGFDLYGTAGGYFVVARFVVGYLLLCLWLHPPQFNIVNQRGLYSRAFWNTVAVYFFLISVNYSGVTSANLLNMTYPAFVALLAPWWLKEKNTVSQWLAVLLAVIGSYLIITDGRVWLPAPADLLGLLSGLTAAIAILSLTGIRKTDSTAAIVWYQFNFGFWISLPFLGVLLWWRMPQLEELIPMAASGLLGFLGQLLLTYGFRFVSAVEGSILSSARIVIAFVFGSLWLRHEMSWLASLGALAILTANLLLALTKKVGELKGDIQSAQP